MIALALSGCLHTGPVPSIGRRATTWDVAVVAATGDRQLEAFYVLETEPLGHGRWQVATTHTRGAWTEYGETSRYDSDAPTTRNPWPLTLEHLVAAVPADIDVEDGRPTALVDSKRMDRSRPGCTLRLVAPERGDGGRRPS